MIVNLFSACFRPHITQMVAKVYIPTLFPLTFIISLLALNLDVFMGFEAGILPSPIHYYISIIMFIVGVILWVWTYEQLTRLGEGSPSPVAGRTIKLAKDGIYAYSRNPSLFGKLTGFIAVGVALNSFSFCCILTPILLCGSLIEKVVRQEPQLVELFGEEYIEYRNNVPLFLPWTFFFPKNKNI